MSLSRTQYNYSMDAFRLDASGILACCPQCGQTNRRRFETLDKTSRCGKCRTELPSVSAPIDVPSADVFSAAVQTSALPVVVDFWAEWCGPCKMVAPEIVKVAGSRAGQLLVVKVDTDALSDVAGAYGIQSIPTMALLHHGRELARTAGARPAAAIISFIEQALAASAR